MNGFNGQMGCDCIVWILILLLCCGNGCGSMSNNCGCILPIILLLLCSGCCGCGHPKC
ncbi:MAG: hypothetical protein J6Q52_04225 [Clostridia bacterium]|nr:hypothetical protein [Clostridia bacterium]